MKDQKQNLYQKNIGDTMKNYNKLYYLKIEIEDLKKEIENLTVLSSSKVSDMPKGSGISNPTEQYLIKKQRLIEKLNKN